MSLAETTIRHRTSALVILALIAIAGYLCYFRLGWLEDPEFTIKDAIITTQYPGATAEEVEMEVTDPLERATQELKQLKWLNYSISSPGLSIIDATVQDKYDKKTLPGIWQQLRNKILDNQDQLPPGCQQTSVNDDFGDVYGILYAVTGRGYTWRELKDYADFLRKELLQVDGVAKVVFWGVQQEAVFLEFSRSRLSEMGISPNTIISSISSQNLVKPAGQVLVGSDYVWIFPTGEYRDFTAIGEQIIRDPKTNATFKIKDFATVRKSYLAPPTNLMRYSAPATAENHFTEYRGEASIGLGISARPDANVVVMGEAIKQRLALVQSQQPYGLELKTITFQGEAVKAAVDNFVENLIEALIIVCGMLLIFTGLRSGFLIGILLLLIVAATFVCMYVQEITLQRISLGALIIALGMLVDDSIVVADGMLVNIKKGMTRIAAANQVVKQNTIPLLGGTTIGILAFAAIGLSPDSTGEYCGSLFWVIFYSLAWSWVMSITVVPLLGNMIFKEEVSETPRDPYNTRFYNAYRRFLTGLIRYRWVTVATLVLGLGAAAWGFRYVEMSFFPESDQPRFYVDFWAPQGEDIRVVDKGISEVAQYLTGVDDKGQRRFPRVRWVSTYAGSGAPRFTLTYSAEQHNSSYGFLMIEVDAMDDNLEEDLFPKLQNYLSQRYPDVQAKINRFKMGASYAATIQARFIGPDAAVLRELANQATAIMSAEPAARYVNADWRQREKVVRPLFSEERARYAGITREDLCNALQLSFTGASTGIYREKNNLIPIYARPQASDRDSIDNLYFATIWSETAQRYIPVQQIVTGFATRWEDTLIRRRYGKRCMIAQCEPVPGVTGPTLYDRLHKKIEAIPLPTGYKLEWGGQKESSDQANDGVYSSLPVSFILMALIVLLLFDSLRQTSIVLLNVPLAMIGVTTGMLVTGVSFGFMAMLGFLGLMGMMIKDAIVLVEAIDHEVKAGKPILQSILDSGVSRVRPVALCAGSTVMGMTPLLPDPFFCELAVVFCFGLSFATVLTLLVSPVFYSIFYNVKLPQTK